jgi:HEAT repeat protein
MDYPQVTANRAPAIPHEIEARLLAALLDADSDRRRIAAETLDAFGPAAAAAVPVIVERSIVDPEPSVRYSLLSSLGRIGWDPATAVPEFTRLLDHDDEIAQARAAWALGRVGPDACSAVPDLACVAGDARRLVDPRWSAVVALERLGPPSEPATPVLLAILRDDPNPDMREASARALGAVSRAQQVVRSLVVALADPDQLVRESAAQGLESIGPAAAPAAATDLERLLADPWPAVRAAAAAALSRLDPQAAGGELPTPEPRHEEIAPMMEHLLEGLRSGNERMRGISTFELGKLGPEAAGAVPLLAELYARDRNLDVRWSAAWGLGKMGRAAADAVPALVRGLVHDADPDVRAQTAWALGRIGPAEVEWSTLIVDVLATALTDEDSLVREEAATALARFEDGAQAARPALDRCVSDPHPLVRQRARLALVALEGRSRTVSADTLDS